MIARQFIRRLATSAIRRSGHEETGGKACANLPFDTHNRYKLTAYFILFFGSAFSLPFFVVRHQLLK